MAQPSLSSLAERILPIVHAARQSILAVYTTHQYLTQEKPDHSPVTVADRASHSILLNGLEGLWPHIPVISEESAMPSEVANSPMYWLVDPLDGTKEFIAGRDEFTINVALVNADGFPLWGLIDIPVTHTTFWGYGGHAARVMGESRQVLDPLVPLEPSTPRRVALSRSHQGWAEQWLTDAHVVVKSTVYAGSAIKFCWIAQGDIDYYPRLKPTMAWDTAAGQALVEAVGGVVEDLSGRRLNYRHPLAKNPSFVARGPEFKG